jgi:mono/diheme cytochrome c family protein
MRILTWLIRIAVALVVIAAVVVAVVFFASQQALSKTVSSPPVSQPDLTHANVARGEHLVKSMLDCERCHGANLGGTLYINEPGVGMIYAPNLTSGNGGFFATYNDVDFVRAVRYGIAPNGRRLLIMPADAFTELSDQDLADVLAYVHAKPKANGGTPDPSVGPIGRVLILTGTIPFPADLVVKQNLAPAQPTIGVTAAYGKYLAHISGCITCHGVGLSGGHLLGTPSDPPAQNLTPSGDLAHWSFDQFKTAIRTGVRPDGTHINTFMPWPDLSQMTDDEIHAIWLYLKSVPPKPTGNG